MFVLSVLVIIFKLFGCKIDDRRGDDAETILDDIGERVTREGDRINTERRRLDTERRRIKRENDATRGIREILTRAEERSQKE